MEHAVGDEHAVVLGNDVEVLAQLMRAVADARVVGQQLVVAAPAAQTALAVVGDDGVGREALDHRRRVAPRKRGIDRQEDVTGLHAQDGIAHHGRTVVPPPNASPGIMGACSIARNVS